MTLSDVKDSFFRITGGKGDICIVEHPEEWSTDIYVQGISHQLFFAFSYFINTNWAIGLSVRIHRVEDDNNG